MTNKNPLASQKRELLIVSPSPHMRNIDSTRSIMLDVIFALIPAAAWGVFIFGLRALLLIAVAVVSAVVFEELFQLVTKRPITIFDFSAVVTGLLMGLNLPAGAPYWIPVVGSFFAIVVVKQLFGGIGKNIVNPVLAARVFLFAWPTEMNLFGTAGQKISISAQSADIITSATPLESLKAGAIPENISLFNTVIGNEAGSIGEVSVLMLALGGLYLLIRRVISWHIPVSFIGTVALLTYFFPRAQGSAGDFMLYEIFSGGLILGAVFMATDYSTSPVTKKGKLIYGVGCGAITVFIRYFGSYPEGVSFGILIMNLLVWYIDSLTRPRPFGAGTKLTEKDG